MIFQEFTLQETKILNPKKWRWIVQMIFPISILGSEF